jgi:hypothetical protein
LRVKLFGKYWSLNFVPNLGKKWGDCSAPDQPKREIRIAAGLRGQQFADTLIHEMIHASQWNLDEDFVEQLASDMARVLCKPEILERINNGSP